MRRNLLDQGPASQMPITALLDKCNPVTRIAAFPEGPAEKAGKGYGYTSRVSSGQTTPRKETDRLSSVLASGVEPPLAKPCCRAMLIYALKCHVLFRPRAVTVGTKFDQLNWCAVNDAEIMATGQTVYTP